MVSFVCNYCQETIKKPKLDQHSQRCHYASFTCVDCMTDFQGTAYRQHTSCISEAEKYQKSLYQTPVPKKDRVNGSHAHSVGKQTKKQQDNILPPNADSPLVNNSQKTEASTDTAVLKAKKDAKLLRKQARKALAKQPMTIKKLESHLLAHVKELGSKKQLRSKMLVEYDQTADSFRLCFT